MDASAVLAFLHREPGCERIEKHLDSGALSAVNLAEAAARLGDEGLSPAQIRQAIEGLQLEIVPCDGEIANRAAWLRSATKDKGLSLGDRICLATAQALGAPALTADSAWAGLKIGVRIELAR